MTSYRIIVTPDAQADLAELRDYIANTLSAPGTALAYVRAVRQEIASLAEMPARCKLLEDEPWHSYGFRRLPVKNFYVYYRIDEPANIVYVLNVIYARRDQSNVLAEKNL
ncbi:MAG: type II toxin-antitoxin system RelE/ParE family toxin [Firmicutes bacterium]|nr:type II toxin-antitoxin system RelE/ParE family toxin [Bacillota bacterium]